MPIEPASGDDVAKLVEAALQQSPETVEIIAAALDDRGAHDQGHHQDPGADDEQQGVEFKSGDEVVTAKISGSRTKITINGEDANRKALAVGMDCEIEYNPTQRG